jgi:hypothetical protein
MVGSMSTWAQTSQGDMVLPTIGNGPSALEHDPRVCAQVRIRAALQTIEGEWFLDTTLGFPWRDVTKKNPDLVAIRHRLHKFLLAIPGVLAVDDLALRYNRQLRDVQYQATVRMDDGTTVSLP